MFSVNLRKCLLVLLTFSGVFLWAEEPKDKPKGPPPMPAVPPGWQTNVASVRKAAQQQGREKPILIAVCRNSDNNSKKLRKNLIDKKDFTAMVQKSAVPLFVDVPQRKDKDKFRKYRLSFGFLPENPPVPMLLLFNHKFQLIERLNVGNPGQLQKYLAELLPVQMEVLRKGKVACLRTRLEKSKFTPPQKKLLLEVFDDIASTRLGKGLLEGANLHTTFVPGSWGGPMLKSPKEISVSGPFLDQILKSKKMQEKINKEFELACLFGEALADSYNRSLPALPRRKPLSFRENFVLLKMAMLLKIAAGAELGCDLILLPRYKDVYQNNQLTAVPAFQFLRQLQVKMMQESGDAENAVNLARSAFLRTYWCNFADTPVKIGNEEVNPPAETVNSWTRNCHKGIFRSLQPKFRNSMGRSTGIDRELARYILWLNTALGPEFFMENNSYKLRTTLFMGYRSGDLNHLIVPWKPNQFADKELRGKKLRQLTVDRYTGNYVERNRDGEETLNVPIKNGRAQGKGFILENGKKIQLEFVNGVEKSFLGKKK